MIHSLKKSGKCTALMCQWSIWLKIFWLQLQNWTHFSYPKFAHGPVMQISICVMVGCIRVRTCTQNLVGFPPTLLINPCPDLDLLPFFHLQPLTPNLLFPHQRIHNVGDPFQNRSACYFKPQPRSLVFRWLL